MAALQPLPTQRRMELGKRGRKKGAKEKRARPITSPKSSEVKYRVALNKFISGFTQDALSAVVPVLRQFEPEYVNDSSAVVRDAYATVLTQAFENLRRLYLDVGPQASLVASSFVESVNNTNKQRFYNAMEDAVGVNLQSIVQDEGLSDILQASVSENVSLIRSIPQEYFKQIESIVFTGTTQGNSATSMVRQILEQGKTTRNRAKLIARDQTTKINSALNQQRQQRLGIEEYVWRTVGDDRVRDTHRTKNGRVFRWDDPPEDTGHPGNDINCRCVAQPIIKVDS